MDKAIVIVRGDEQRERIRHYADIVPIGWRVVFEKPRRTGDQNDIFHALCNDIVKMGLKWGGREWSAEQWKVLLVSGHGITTGTGSMLIPGLEGEFVNVRESTARMSKERGSSLIEYTQAFIAAHEHDTEN